MIPKGYKHTELGVLPEDWEVVRLVEVCDVRDGTHESPKPTNEGKILITSKNLKGGKIDFSDSYHISLEDFEAINKRSKVEKYDILMSMIGTVGEVAFVDIEPNFAIKNVALFKMDGNEKFSKFLFFFFQSSIGKKCILSFLSGSTQKYITLDFLRNLQIPLPPLAEQEKIAGILSAWDTQIQNFETLITEKQALKKGLCQTLLTAKTRLKGFSGDWEVVRLGEIAEIKTGDSNREDSTESSGAYTFFDRSQDIRTSNRYLFDCEAIIVGGEGSDFVPKYFEGKFDLHQRSYAITKAKACIKYLYYFITQYRNFFLKMAVGSTVKSLRMNCFTEFPILLPLLAEQEKIAEILGEGDKEIMLLEQKLESLKSQKKGLMQNLLNGKVRV